MFFRSFIGLFVEGYFEFLIAVLMNLDHPYPGYMDGEYMAYISAQLFRISVFFFLPFLNWYVIKSSHERVSSERFKKRFDLVVEDINTHSKLSRWYFTLYTIRRIVFCVIVFYYNVPSSIQIILILLINLFMLIYVANKIFNHRLLNRF